MSTEIQEYCDYNHDLFKSFTSMKTKIIPQFADDWVMIPDAYNRNDGFSLRSESINQEVADINLRRFLEFTKRYNIAIVGGKLVGEYIIGADRSVYTKEMFDKWFSIFEERKPILKEELVIGNIYKGKCGKSYAYLGEVYISKFKSSYHDAINGEMTKPTKHTFVTSPTNHSNTHLILHEPEFVEDQGQCLSSDQVNELYNRCQLSGEFRYFSRVKPKKDVQPKFALFKPKNNEELKSFVGHYSSHMTKTLVCYYRDKMVMMRNFSGDYQINENGSISGVRLIINGWAKSLFYYFNVNGLSDKLDGYGFTNDMCKINEWFILVKAYPNPELGDRLEFLE